MSRIRGGKKRTDKKAGRKTKGWYSARTFSQMASGQANSGNGQMRSAEGLKLDQNKDFFTTVLPNQCAERTVRNKVARENRGTVTGRRPWEVTPEEWQRRISGGGRGFKQQVSNEESA